MYIAQSLERLYWPSSSSLWLSRLALSDIKSLWALKTIPPRNCCTFLLHWPLPSREANIQYSLESYLNPCPSSGHGPFKFGEVHRESLDLIDRRCLGRGQFPVLTRARPRSGVWSPHTAWALSWTGTFFITCALSLSFSLWFYMSLFLSRFFSLAPFFSIYRSVSGALSLALSLSSSLPIVLYPSLSPSLALSVCMSVSLSLSLSMYMYMYVYS